MQQGTTLQIFRAHNYRSRAVAKPNAIVKPMPVPSNCNAGDLVEILEFLQV